MHRANAAKALRTDAVEKWQRIAAAAREHTADEEGLQNLMPSHDGAYENQTSSFFQLFEGVAGVGTGAALHHADAAGPHSPIPTFWSPKTDLPALLDLLKGSPINLLLILVPVGFMAQNLGFSPTWIFILNFVGIIPLALILGDVTEDLALRCGDVIGGLVNATFGNVVELILSCVALSKKQPKLNEVAGLSNLGSILSNLLLVLGCCFFFGGLHYEIQEFNSIANRVSNSLLFLAVIGLVLPCAMPLLPKDSFTSLLSSEDITLHFSRMIAILLLVTYVVYLYFQLVSHNKYFLPPAEPAIEENGEEVELEKPALTVTAELGTLLAISLVVAVASEKITDSIEGMAEGSGLSAQFLSLVLLPLAGNAVEHITAVMVAIKNKMDLALAIAIGSSIQIAIFVLPTCVLFAWSIDNPFSLQLDPLGTLSLAVAIIHANFITSGGKSHYLMGVQLVCTYLIISAAFLF